MHLIFVIQPDPSWGDIQKEGDIVINCQAESQQDKNDIKAGAGDESDWATLTVTMPYSYDQPMLQFFEWLFETIATRFDQLPYISVKPIDIKAIRNREREIDQSMFW